MKILLLLIASAHCRHFRADRFSRPRSFLNAASMDARLRRIEQDLEHDLELQSAEGSRLTRMIQTLHKPAKSGKKVQAILRSFSLL